MENQLLNLVKTRRSTRVFTDEKVAREDLEQILTVARFAPSSWGNNPVHFIVVEDREELLELAKCKAMGAKPVENASAAVVVAIDTSNCELWIEDGSVAATYMLLAAEELGLGACWVEIRDRKGQVLTAEEEIRGLLGIPAQYAVLSIVALGKKGQNKQAKTEEELPDGHIHYGVF